MIYAFETLGLTVSHLSDSYWSSPCRVAGLLCGLCASWASDQASCVVRVDRPASCMRAPLLGGVAEVVKCDEKRWASGCETIPLRVPLGLDGNTPTAARTM